ncbi:MAG: TolC family protein [Acidobacteria bacterium]|nr:TolC family protein [Candidatus Sulfomarinibacter sp. MAG AM1]
MRWMNLKTLCVLVAVSLAAPAIVVEAQEIQDATLKEFVLQAIETHEMVQIADSEIRRAQADVSLAKSIFLPKLDANGSYTFYDDDLSIELSPDESFVVRPRQDWTASIDLRQNLFTGLRAFRARDIAKLNRDIADLDRWTTINNLTLDVARKFFDAVAMAEWVEVREIVLEENENQLKVAERLFEVGENSVADVARWRAQVAAAKQALTVAVGDAALARNRLARLAGTADFGELKSPGPVPIPAGTEDELTTNAFGQRPEMLTLIHQLEAAGLMVKFERGVWYPQVDATAQYFQQKSGFPANDWMSLTLNLRQQIFNGGITKAQVAKAREDLRQVELLEQTLRRSIADEVDSAYIGYAAASAVFDAARERTEASRLAYRQVERAYRVGEASTTDLLNATTVATDAETSQIVARVQREFQAISLRYAVGLPPLPDLDFRQMSQADPQEN